jgi:hypothetical protein
VGAGGLAVPPGRRLAGPFDLPDCRSPQALFDAPTEPGKYPVTLFRKTPSGYTAVAQDVLTVG